MPDGDPVGAGEPRPLAGIDRELRARSIGALHFYPVSSGLQLDLIPSVAGPDDVPVDEQHTGPVRGRVRAHEDVQDSQPGTGFGIGGVAAAKRRDAVEPNQARMIAAE
ncbi:hypothetical protein GCM10027447_03770 [Glycomyces halotolerans]